MRMYLDTLVAATTALDSFNEATNFSETTPQEFNLVLHELVTRGQLAWIEDGCGLTEVVLVVIVAFEVTKVLLIVGNQSFGLDITAVSADHIPTITIYSAKLASENAGKIIYMSTDISAKLF